MSKHKALKRAPANDAKPTRFTSGPMLGAGYDFAEQLEDLRVPGVVADLRALLPWVDADHDHAPTKKNGKATSVAPAIANETATGIPNDFAEKIATMKASAFAVEIASLKYDHSPGSKYRLADILERADDSMTRKKLKEQYAQQNNGVTLETYIESSSNLGANGKKNALDLVSGKRDVATDKLAAMDPKARADMEDKAAVWASKVFEVTRSDDRDDSEHADKIASILGPRSPEELELIRARVRTQTSGTKRATMYEELDRSFTGRDKDIALSGLSGNHVQVAATQLVDAAAEKDPDRVHRIVEELGPEKVKQLGSTHAVLLQQVTTSMPSDQRKQVEAALAGREAAADAARFGELLQPIELSTTDAFQDPAKTKRKMMLKEAQSPERMIEEFGKKSPAELAAARAEWDTGGHDKTWDQLIAERYKGVDSTLRLRIEAASRGDTIGEKALRLRQGMRTFDQKLIDGALANTDLKSGDEQKRAAAEAERSQLEMRMRMYDANDKRTSATLEGKQSDFAGRSMQEQLDAYYEKAKTHDTKAGKGFLDQAAHMATRESRMEKIAEKAKVDSFAASEMWADGDARASTKVRRAELAGNSMQKAEILERLDSKKVDGSTTTLAATSAEYSAKFGKREMLKAPDMSGAKKMAEMVARMTGDERPTDEIAKQLARSEMNVGEMRTEHVRETGVLADRSRGERLAQQKELRDLSHSGWLEGSETMRYVMGGNRGSEDLLQSSINMMERGNVDDVDDREMSRRDRATTGALMLQRDEKQREAAKIAQVLSIASKIAAVLTMNPALFVAVDAGFSALRIAAQEMIANEAYEMTNDLKHMAVDFVINIATAKLGGLGKGLEAGTQAAKTAQTMQRVGNIGVAVGGGAAHAAIDGQELGGGGIVRAGLGAVLPSYVRGKAEGVIKGTGRVASASRAVIGTATDAMASASVGGGTIDAAGLIGSVGNTYQNHTQGKKSSQAHVESHASSSPRMPDVDGPTTARAKRTTIPMPTVAEPVHARKTLEMPVVQAPIETPLDRAWAKSTEPHRPPPATHVEAIERSTGIDKGAEYEQFRRDMASMYAHQEVEAQNVTRVRGSPVEQKKDGSYYQGKQDYDVRRFGYDNGTLTSVTIDAHLRAGAGTTPEQIEAVKRSVYQGTDQIMNRNDEGKRHTLPDGSKLQVEPIFHDDAAKAKHVADVIQPGFGPDGLPLHSNQAQWVLPQVLNPTGATHELVGHGLGFPDTYVDPKTWFRDTPNAPGVTHDGNFMETVAPGAGLAQRQLDQLGRDISGQGGATATVAQGAATTAPSMPPDKLAFGHFAEDADVKATTPQPDEASLARAIAEIPLHRVPTAKDGEPAMSGHPDTYYLSREDATRMQQMLELQEGTKVRAYEKGFIARRGGEEWYFEVGDTKGLDPVMRAKENDPNGPAPEKEMENAMPMREDGMPTPNAATIEVWGFRGVRSIEGRERREWTPEDKAHAEQMKQIQPLLYAGHIGVSTDGGESIQGYTPKVPDGMSVDDAIKALFRYEAFPGNFADDTHVFEHATEMAEKHDWNTRPASAVQLVDPAVKQAIIEQMARYQHQPHDLAYSFPTGQEENGVYFKESNGYPADCVSNCATFPARVGVQIPEPSGNLNVFMPELLKWAESGGPIDLRTQPGTKKPEGK